MAGGEIALPGDIEDIFHAAAADLALGMAGDTESTALGAAAHDFNGDTVMHGIGVRDDRSRWENGAVEIINHCPPDAGGQPGFIGHTIYQSTVGVILAVIKLRYIHKIKTLP
ncbi:MAG: hypothetical protein AMJ78_04235 [Omnitrophica WOR_2 bacterium SM23_29]|nr:MAG: hypothetical protein AMJ78_04235 [Omnitrophica WOR_2 bacterium SM23_29]